MKQTTIAISVLTLLLFSAACATTATPSVQGVVTAIDGNALTVTPVSGQPTTVNVSRSTVFSWFSGADASRSDVVTGQRVSVWLKEGTQNASRLVIEP